MYSIEGPWFYVFISVIVVFTILASWFQYRNKKLEEEDGMESETKHPFEDR